MIVEVRQLDRLEYSRIFCLRLIAPTALGLQRIRCAISVSFKSVFANNIAIC
jgi:hypothetical protein